MLFVDGPLNVDKVSTDIPAMFRPFQDLLFKIRSVPPHQTIVFVLDGIPSVADYNLTPMGVVVVVVVVVAIFTMG